MTKWYRNDTIPNYYGSEKKAIGKGTVFDPHGRLMRISNYAPWKRDIVVYQGSRGKHYVVLPRQDGTGYGRWYVVTKTWQEQIEEKREKQIERYLLGKEIASRGLPNEQEGHV